MQVLVETGDNTSCADNTFLAYNVFPFPTTPECQSKQYMGIAE